MVDGWAYFSDAVRSLLAHHRESALHLAYYGELRAAMSLLAAEGIGVFATRHFALRDNAPPLYTSGNTHQAVWPILQAWSQDTARAGTFLDTLTIQGKTINDWVAIGSPTYVATAQLAKHWLSEWSLDLHEPSNDRDLRNEASYRPWAIRSPSPRIPAGQDSVVTPIVEAWSMLQPGPVIGGTVLDTHLLKRVLSDVAAATGIRGWDVMRNRLTGVASEPLLDFLAPAAGKVPQLFQQSKIPLDANVLDPRPVMARSLLLLRLAAASVNRLCLAAGVTVTDLEFWAGPYGANLRLWPEPRTMESFSDLWTDVEEAIAEVPRDPAATAAEVFAKLVAYPALTQFTRVPLWLMPA